MMKIFAPGVLLALSIFLSVSSARAADPASGMNSAAVIHYPTALNQTQTQVFAGTLDIVNVENTDLRVSNFRYGYQVGDFQFTADIQYLTQPDSEYNYAEVRAKLRVLPLDEIRSNLALGLLGRYADPGARTERIDDRDASIFLVFTNQFFIFGTRSAVTSFYLDNLNASGGLKSELYQQISLVIEGDYLHAIPDAPDRGRIKYGVEIEGEQNFYMQLFVSGVTHSVHIQVGSGF